MSRRVCILILLVFIAYIASYVYFQHNTMLKVHIAASSPGSDSVYLQKGDILARPNWYLVPGSSTVPEGRKYGHVAVIINDCSGKNIDDALVKADVIEALFFDQKTKSFLWHKKDQIRIEKAAVSFGKKFTGIRYHLSTHLTDSEADSLVIFLKNQLDGGYSLFSKKNNIPDQHAFSEMKSCNWHCATLVWEAFRIIKQIDIDANGGKLVYPSDIIASKRFDKSGDRQKF